MVMFNLADKEYKIRDLTIDDEFAVISSGASIKEAAELMKAENVPDLVVIDEKERVVGVLADFDIVQNIIAEGLDPKTAKVLSSMYTITPVTLETTVTDAFTRLRDLGLTLKFTPASQDTSSSAVPSNAFIEIGCLGSGKLFHSTCHIEINMYHDNQG